MWVGGERMKARGLFRWLMVLAPLLLAAGAASARTVGLFDSSDVKITPIGWAGFTDMKFMAESTSALLLAIVLGGVIGFHPTTPRTVDQLHEAEMPKVYIMYAFIAAVIGVTVREFGMVIGVVVFGIGGLIRFRTPTDSARDTGRLIVVTLTGLIAGLGLPHLAVIATAFAFVLVWLFDSKPACRVRIHQVPEGRLAECAEAYGAILRSKGCKIIAEHKSPLKAKVEFVFFMPMRGNRENLHAALGVVHPDLRGDIDWEVE